MTVGSGDIQPVQLFSLPFVLPVTETWWTWTDSVIWQTFTHHRHNRQTSAEAEYSLVYVSLFIFTCHLSLLDTMFRERVMAAERNMVTMSSRAASMKKLLLPYSRSDRHAERGHHNISGDRCNTCKEGPGNCRLTARNETFTASATTHSSRRQSERTSGQL